MDYYYSQKNDLKNEAHNFIILFFIYFLPPVSLLLPISVKKYNFGTGVVENKYK